MGDAAAGRNDISTRLARLALYRWWRRAIVGRVDHAAVVARIVEESSWSPRFAFMIMMSAGIAVLGLLLSSPAVVIGAMLISPLMSPILGFGYDRRLNGKRSRRLKIRGFADASPRPSVPLLH